MDELKKCIVDKCIKLAKTKNGYCSMHAAITHYHPLPQPPKPEVKS